MSQSLPNMLESSLQKVKELIDVNSVVGDPIVTPEGVTILPVCKVSYGFGGGGSDFSTKSAARAEYPFGGGTGVGAKITPIAFLIVKGESVRLIPVGAPASTTADRVVELVPDVLDKISAFVDSRTGKKE
ncbi:MAG: GerW family sporulation protein [Candidatus Faecousia sp.]|nr:GerW family sporulation protein [Clostridiales bacterium]MDD7651722.1 GerW family sporulation protein [Bacillota bacterium]MDY4219758.1 GerW family sporulation protein [Candidatus Faecousia sp.]